MTIKPRRTFIIDYLISNGVSPQQIVYEKSSTNTLENVKFALNVFDFSQIKSLMFICKSHATGRQLRTLTKYLPATIDYIPYTFNAEYSGNIVSRQEWMNKRHRTVKSVGRVFENTSLWAKGRYYAFKNELMIMDHFYYM